MSRQEIVLGRGESRRIFALRDGHEGAESLSDYNVTLAEGASLEVFFLTLHGDMTRNNIVVNLQGKHAECRLYGISIASGSERVEMKVDMNHNFPDCCSDQLFKCILADEGRSMFDGKILVAPDAQRTAAYQANHSLLLSAGARADSKPQLEIYADDVKCSHGASTGRLDEQALFYMRSRGISLERAAILQQLAFAGEVLDRLEDEELREKARQLIEERLLEIASSRAGKR